MNKIVGVQCGKDGKIYSVDTGHFVLRKGDEVLIDTHQGPAFTLLASADGLEQELTASLRQLLHSEVVND